MMADRPDLIQSELAGLAFDSAQSIFRPIDIDNMFEQKPFDSVISEDIYICIDPAGFFCALKPKLNTLYPKIKHKPYTLKTKYYTLNHKP